MDIGRIEYITSTILAIILIITGIISIKESIEKIITPVVAEYTLITFIVIIASIIVKFVFGTYVKKVGEKVNNGSLIATGTDSYLDAIITFSTLVAAFISKFFGISLEGILGALLSILIVKSGIEILIETLNSIIGTRIDSELSKKIKDKINSYEQVEGTYDLILHNYGPITTIGSVHIEVPAEMIAKDIHKLTKKISIDIFNEFGIILTVGIYASDIDDNEYMKTKNKVNEVLEKYPEILQMHAFYIDSTNNEIAFDIVIDFKAEESREEIKEKIKQELKEIYKDYNFDIIIDNDFSDL